MKIKKVIIDGFRAYENAENGTFDFSTDSGDCADFVAIFAPNGFGKTSFYDALEYALTENISRFVRDAHRGDYDSKSRTQVQRKRKQYVLRNHTISDSSIAKIQVTLDIAGREKLIEKEIPKPKGGNRDFHFKKKSLDDSSFGLPDVFLSQEAIDAFLREEKAEARYLRFMSNFGDSDEIYRANLGTLRRELESSLDDARYTLSQVRAIAERPINLQIFNEINQSITSLEDEESAIHPIDENFNAEQELSLRNEIARRLYELNLSNENYEKNVAALTQLTSAYPRFMTALKRKKNAANLTAEIAESRLEFEKLENARRSAEGLEENVQAARRNKTALSEIALQTPEFESANVRRKAATDSKNVHIKGLNLLHVDLAATEQREVQCKLRIDEVDAAIRSLLNSQQSSAATFGQIEVKEETIKTCELELNQRKKYVDALVTKMQQDREQFEKIRALRIDNDSLESLELMLIASDEFSLIELRAALVELSAKEAILDDRTKALKATKVKVGKIAQFVDLGRTLVNELKTPQCPLCSHTHDSYLELLNKILDNQNLTAQEDEALRQTQDAEYALASSRAHVTNLFRQAEKAKLKRVEELRQFLSADEVELSARRNALKDISDERSLTLQELTELKNATLNLTPSLFSEKIRSEINQRHLIKEAELLDLAETTRKIKELQSRRKHLWQEAEAEQAKIDVIEEDEVFRRVFNFCKERQIDLVSARKGIENELSESSAQVDNLEKKFSQELSLITELIAKKPHLSTWSEHEALAKKTRAQQDELAADTVIIPYITGLKLQIQNFEDARLEEDLVSVISDTLSTVIKKRDANARMLRGYNVLEQQLDNVGPFVESLQAQRHLKVLELELQEKEALESILQSEYQSATVELDKKIQTFFYPDLINSIYRRIDPHPDFKRVEFACDFENEKPTLEVFVADQEGDLISPNLYFSAAQVNILSLSIFLARALHAKDGESEIGCIFIDDPIHSMDSINVLSTIDLLRSLSLKFNRQIILSTHDKNFFELLQRKLPSEQCKAKFLELETFGKVSQPEKFIGVTLS